MIMLIRNGEVISDLNDSRHILIDREPVPEF